MLERKLDHLVIPDLFRFALEPSKQQIQTKISEIRV